MDAVGREELVVIVAADQIHIVVVIVAIRIGLLNRAARRGEVTRNGKSQRRAIGVGYLALHQTLTKRASSHDRASVVILHRAGQNLARRGTTLVDEHYQSQIRCRTRAVAELLDLLAVAILRIYDQLACGQELVGDQNRLIEEAARIIAQVENQLGHTLLTQLREGLLQLHKRRAGKLRQTNEADAIRKHRRRLDTLDGDGIAHNRNIDQLVDILTLERESHLRAASSAQTLDDVVLRHLHTRHQRIVDLDDAIARHDSRLGTRAIGNDTQHDNRIGRSVERHANTVELALQRLVQLLHLACGDIYRVRIQLAHHQRDDQLGERIHRDRVHKTMLDEHTRLHNLVCHIHTAATYERANLRLGTVAPDELSQQYSKNHSYGQNQRKEYRVFRVFVHISLIYPRKPTIGIPFFSGPCILGRPSARDAIIYS